MSRECCTIVRDQLIDLYLQVKIRKADHMSESKMIKEEQQKLIEMNISCSDLIQYIISSVDIMMNMKLESEMISQTSKTSSIMMVEASDRKQINL